MYFKKLYLNIEIHLKHLYMASLDDDAKFNNAAIALVVKCARTFMWFG